ncbi:MAG: site-specific integrase [Actinomycetota bacterium]|nr:site-specific integrase [Actinomycetota bacterium]
MYSVVARCRTVRGVGVARRRGFGAIRRLPSKRYQASYTGPDTLRHLAPVTFETREDAEGWLASRRSEIRADDWTPPVRRAPLPFAEVAERWLSTRTLRPRTRVLYRRLLDQRLLPTFGEVPVKAVTADLVADWHHRQGTGTPTATAHAYSLLRSILGDALQRGLLARNPCHIRGAGASKRIKKIRPASLVELEVLVSAMPERYRAMVLLAAWCGLRFGELTELRRADVDLTNGIVHVRRAVVRVNGAYVVGLPKSSAGIRDVHLPPHLSPVVKEHLNTQISGGRDGLLFPAADGLTHLAGSTLYKPFYRARDAAGRPDLRFHDLRHTGAVLAAQTGATLAELMARLGHTTPQMALRYQHASADRDLVIAQALSRMVGEGKDG